MDEPLDFADPLGHLTVQSGGSTAAPRCLRRPVSTWVASAQVEGQVFGLQSTDCFAVLGSPAHSLWAYAHFRAHHIGATCHGFESLDRGLPTKVRTAAVTVVYGVPELIATTARQIIHTQKPLTQVRRILMGGGPLPPNFSIEEVTQAFPQAQIWMFYGTAEASFIGFGIPGQPYQPFPSVDMQVRNGNQLWVRSPMTLNPGSWLNTGDLGCWVHEDQFLVTGRAARQLVVKGLKFSVEPAEDWLRQRFAFDRVALFMNNGRQVCCVYTEPSERRLREQLPTDFRAELNKALLAFQADFPLIRVVVRANQWPLMSSGKTDWLKLFALVEGMPT